MVSAGGGLATSPGPLGMSRTPCENARPAEHNTEESDVPHVGRECWACRRPWLAVGVQAVASVRCPYCGAFQLEFGERPPE